MPAKIKDSELASARRLYDRGISIDDIAVRTKIGRATLYRYLAGKPSRTAPAPRLPLDTGSLPPADAPEAPADVAPPPPKDGPAAGFDAIKILGAAMTALQDLQRELSTSGDVVAKRALPNVVRALSEVVKQFARLSPPTYPTAEELEEKSQPKAAEVVAELRKGILRLKRADLETGACSRCKAPLSDETRGEWRAQVDAALNRGED